MPDRIQRLLWGIVMTPTAAVLGFLVGGHLAAWTATSGSALADSASVAVIGLASAIAAAGVTAWVATRKDLRHLPRATGLLLLVTALAVWATLITAN